MAGKIFFLSVPVFRASIIIIVIINCSVRLNARDGRIGLGRRAEDEIADKGKKPFTPPMMDLGAFFFRFFVFSLIYRRDIKDIIRHVSIVSERIGRKF